MSVQDVIAKAREAAQTVIAESVSVVVGDLLVEVTFEKVLGSKWSEITATHPPRDGADTDKKLGYNLHAAAIDYPSARIRIAGDTPTTDEWVEFFRLLDAPYQDTIALKLWRMNQYGPASRILELGKASSGAASKKKRPSPSN